MGLENTVDSSLSQLLCQSALPVPRSRFSTSISVCKNLMTCARFNLLWSFTCESDHSPGTAIEQLDLQGESPRYRPEKITRGSILDGKRI